MPSANQPLKVFLPNGVRIVRVHDDERNPLRALIKSRGRHGAAARQRLQALPVEKQQWVLADFAAGRQATLRASDGEFVTHSPRAADSTSPLCRRGWSLPFGPHTFASGPVSCNDCQRALWKLEAAARKGRG